MDIKKLENKLEKLLSEELIRLEEIKNGSEYLTYLPNHIYVEPTNICNLKCATCTPKEIKGKPGKLSMDVWRDIVDYFEEIGANPAITLIGRGEPLLHPQIDEIVRYATDKGLSCYIITNGTVFTNKKAKLLVSAGLNRIQFSLHATTAETYKKMTERSLFEQVINNIEEFQRINDDAGHPCHVSVFSVVSSINEHEMEDFRAIWEDKVDRVHMHRMFSLHGDSKMTDQYKKEDIVSPGNGTKGCSIPWWFFTIRWDGAIVPCALDHASRIVVENIYNKEGKVDLKSAWNSKIFRKIRRAEAAGDYQTLRELGYDCASCGARMNPHTFNDIERYISGFAKHFTLQFIPIVQDLAVNSR